MTSKQRAEFRAKANGLDTIVQIGKGGINDPLITQVNGALNARELIKLKVLENAPLTVDEAAGQLSEALFAEVIQIIGSKFVLYRENPELREAENKKKEKKPVKVQKIRHKSNGKPSYKTTPKPVSVSFSAKDGARAAARPRRGHGRHVQSHS